MLENLQFFRERIEIATLSLAMTDKSVFPFYTSHLASLTTCTKSKRGLSPFLRPVLHFSILGNPQKRDCGACLKSKPRAKRRESEEAPGLLRLHLATISSLAMTRGLLRIYYFFRMLSLHRQSLPNCSNPPLPSLYL